VRERRSVREFSDKQKEKTKNTLDTAGVVRDGPLMAPHFPSLRNLFIGFPSTDLVARLA
jgi:hypothetical protein